MQKKCPLSSWAFIQTGAPSAPQVLSSFKKVPRRLLARQRLIVVVIHEGQIRTPILDTLDDPSHGFRRTRRPASCDKFKRGAALRTGLRVGVGSRFSHHLTTQAVLKFVCVTRNQFDSCANAIANKLFTKQTYSICMCFVNSRAKPSRSKKQAPNRFGAFDRTSL